MAYEISSSISAVFSRNWGSERTRFDIDRKQTLCPGHCETSNSTHVGALISVICSFYSVHSYLFVITRIMSDNVFIDICLSVCLLPL